MPPTAKAPADDALAREPPVERPDGRQAQEHPDPAGADQPRERSDALVEALAEHDEREHQDQPLPQLVEPDRRDRSDRPGRVHDVAQPVGELHADPSELVAQQLGGLRQLVRAEVAADACGERRGGHPHRRPPRDTIAPLPKASETSPPAKTPTSKATVPPTVAIEFAASRSSVGTRRGTTAWAVARKNRFTDVTNSAPP